VNTQEEAFNREARLLKRLCLGVAIATGLLGVMPHLPLSEEWAQVGRPWSGFMLLLSVILLCSWASLRWLVIDDRSDTGVRKGVVMENLELPEGA